MLPLVVAPPNRATRCRPRRLLQRYLGTRLGEFDLTIALLTAPWFLLPGVLPGGGLVVVLRPARLAR